MEACLASKHVIVPAGMYWGVCDDSPRANRRLVNIRPRGLAGQPSASGLLSTGGIKKVGRSLTNS